jgi:hypothetical protein
MLRKALGKTLDYFFGFGDKQDYYHTLMKYNWAFKNKNKTGIGETVDKVAKIITRSSLTLVQAINIYYAIVNNTPKALLFIPLIEIPRTFSLFSDYEYRKEILEKKERAINRLFHPDQFKEKRKKRNDFSDIDDADWWKE